MVTHLIFSVKNDLSENPFKPAIHSLAGMRQTTNQASHVNFSMSSLTDTTPAIKPIM